MSTYTHILVSEDDKNYTLNQFGDVFVYDSLIDIGDIEYIIYDGNMEPNQFAKLSEYVVLMTEDRTPLIPVKLFLKTHQVDLPTMCLIDRLFTNTDVLE